MVTQSHPLLSHFQASGAPLFTRKIGLGYFPWNRWLKLKLTHHLEKQTGGSDPRWTDPLEASTHEYQEKSKEQHFLALCTDLAVLFAFFPSPGSLYIHMHLSLKEHATERQLPRFQTFVWRQQCLILELSKFKFSTLSVCHPYFFVWLRMSFIGKSSLSCTGYNSPLIRL